MLSTNFTLSPHFSHSLNTTTFFSSGLMDSDLSGLEEETTRRNTSFHLLEQWQNLSQEKKNEEILLRAFKEIEEFSNGNFTAVALEKQRRYFFTELDNDLCDNLMQVWWLLPLKEQRERMKLGLVELALEAYLYVNPEASYESTYAYCVSLFSDDEPLTTAPFLEELRLYKLKRNLEWTKLNDLSGLNAEPLRLFKAVLVHNKHPFPQEEFWTDLSNYKNFTASLAPSNTTNLIFGSSILRSLDEAGLIWQQFQTGTMFTDIEEDDGQFSVNLLRSYYLPHLIESYLRQNLIDKLFMSEGANEHAIYFDGFAFRNAKGKLFTDLVEVPELQLITEYRNLSQEHKRELLKEAFAQKGESIQYALGSLEHSLASSLIRIYRYHKYRVPPPFSDIQLLIELFKEAEEQWENKKDYPIHPRLLLAGHLARTNGVVVEGTTWQQKSKFLLSYLADAFEQLLDSKQIELKPTFDPAQAALELLQGLGMTLDEIYQPREYTIIRWRVVIAPGSTLSKVRERYSGDAIDEFLAKSRANELFTFRDRTINPKLELTQKEEAYNQFLLQDLWLSEKAEASLSAEGIPIDPHRLKQEVSLLANKYQQKTLDHQAWVQTTKNWSLLIPIIGPLETLYGGIGNKSWKEIFLGGLFLSLDAWAISELAGWAARKVLGSALSASRVSVRERMTIASVEATLSESQLPLQELAQESTSVNLNQNPFIATDIDNEIEEAGLMQMGQVTAEQTRSNQKIHARWIFLHDENRAVLATPQGAGYREVNWQSGEVDFSRPLIYKNSDTGVYTVSPTNTVGSRRYSIPIPSLSKAELRQRYTVKEVLKAMERANDYSIYSDFSTRFRKYFKVIYPIVSSSLDMESYYENLYKVSPTFRRIFNKFIKKAEWEPENNIWKMEIKQGDSHLLKGQGCSTNLITKVICIDPQSESSLIKYIGDTFLGDQAYAGEAFQNERAATHELLHALINADDLETGVQNIHNPFIRKDPAIARSHRGGIVYLTDRILFESVITKRFPQRLVYRYFEEDYPLNFDILKNRLVEENGYLDDRLDSDIPIEEYAMVGGESIEQRSAVRSTADFFSSLQPTRIGMAIEHVRGILEDGITGEDEFLEELYNFFETLFADSKTFRSIFITGYHRIEQLMSPFKFIELDFNKLAGENSVIYETENAAYFFDDGVVYLSDNGIVPLEKKRKYLYKMLELLTDFKLGDAPISAQMTSRSPLLQIADKILHEAEMDNYPKCLAEAFILPGDIEREKKLLQNWSWLSRMAHFEDKYLEQNVYNKLEFKCLSCINPRSKREASEKNVAAQTTEISQQIKETAPHSFKASRIQPNFSNGSPGFFKKVILVTAALSVGASIIPSMHQTNN